LDLTGVFVALLVLLGAVVWGPWWGTQELAQAQDVAGGGLDEPSKGSDEDKRSAGSNEVSEVGGLPEDKGQQGPKATTSSPRLANANLPGGDATPQGRAEDEDPGAGIPVEPGSDDNVALNPGSERVRVPEVRGTSAEEASQALSDSGHVVAGTTKRRSPEPSGTVIETYPAVGSSVERGTAVAIVLSSGPTSQEDSNTAENEARVTTKEETTETTQPSKTRKRNQKSSTVVFVKGWTQQDQRQLDLRFLA
jgi:beta-lactam-binding protein with PASTA domain